MRDYLAFLKKEPKDAIQHGIKGMKWGQRRTDAQLANDTAKRKTSGEEVTDTARAKSAPSGPEPSATRYARLQGEASSGGSKNWSQEDLNFFNSRTDALNKVNKLYEQNPGWLSTTSKTVLQKAAQRTMQDILNGVTNQYITGPVLDAVGAQKPKKKND